MMDEESKRKLRNYHNTFRHLSSPFLSTILGLIAALRKMDPNIRVVSARISKTENPQKIEFAIFWCRGTPLGVIQESQIFLLSDPYFGFYGGLKF